MGRDKSPRHLASRAFGECFASQLSEYAAQYVKQYNTKNAQHGATHEKCITPYCCDTSYTNIFISM